MSTWVEVMAARFAELYARIPDVQCKGLCHEACGPIDMHPYERLQLRRAGVKLPPPLEQMEELAETGTYRCPALTADNRCSAYVVRPLICRMWGAVEGLPCEHGCLPADGRRMSNAEAQDIFAAAVAEPGSDDPGRAR